MGTAFSQLKARLAEVRDLDYAGSVLNWDQETHMPPAGIHGRSEQLATLSKLSHETFTAPLTGRLLKQAAAESDVTRSRAKSAIVRVAQRDYAQAKKLPTDFVAEVTRHQSQAQQAWARARKANDFKSFAPWLKKSFDYARRQADYLGWKEHPYDALLDVYEPGATAALIRTLFADLRAQQVPLVKAIQAHADRVSDDCLRREYPKAAQEAFAIEAAKRVGYSFERGRMDYTAHPFCTNFSRDDVRITTRADERFFNPMFFSVLHEAGHAMYEQGVSPIWARTPVGSGASLGVHESQSRMWENLVGRSRPFWIFMYPHLQRHLPAFADVPLETFYKAINRSKPTLIRVEADEVTYNLHIMVRFELELALLEGKLRVKDVPDAWNAKYDEYLGLRPPTDADGCLQDIHWSMGLIGYFPTYTLGNLMSVQLFEAARRDIPDLQRQFTKGKFDALLAWMNQHVHQHGRSLQPNELISKATGQRPTAAPYLAYLRAKYSDIYGLDA